VNRPHELLYNQGPCGRVVNQYLSPYGCRAASRLAYAAVGHLGQASPNTRVGAVAAKAKHRCSRRPCHSHAIRSGHKRYAADSHGHFEEAGGLGARP
jgi:hypothetical protein